MTAQTTDIYMALGCNRGHRINTVPGCSRTMGPFLLKLLFQVCVTGTRRVTNIRVLGRVGFGLPSSCLP